MLTFFVVVFAAIVFEYSNGFHDAANAIATVVSTKVLTPRQAIVMAAIFNLTGALLGGAVASTMGTTASGYGRGGVAPGGVRGRRGVVGETRSKAEHTAAIRRDKRVALVVNTHSRRGRHRYFATLRLLEVIGHRITFGKATTMN